MVSQSILLSIIHVMTFYLYIAKYARLRKNQNYAQQDKPPVEDMPLARKITKLAFVASSLLVLLGFWIQDARLGYFQAPFPLRAAGVLITLCAFLFLSRSLDQLGKNYSPLFDTHRPLCIVDSGPYKYIRHPVYLCNILILLGYVFSGASIPVFVLSLWGWGYMLRSIAREEAFLAKEFPGYPAYQKRTWRIVPYVY